MMIYVIDDHPLMRDAIATVLRRLRPDMCIVELGTLAELRPNDGDAGPGVIFLDLNLPGAPGCSAVNQVKRSFPTMPLAVYSALPAADMEKKCTDAGADIYIEKTANSQELAAALCRLLSTNPAQRRSGDGESLHGRVLRSLVNEMPTTTIPVFSWRASANEETLSTQGGRDIVVVDAAAGGLTALCKVLSGLPPGFDAAILIALDIGSQPDAIVLQILRSYSQLSVNYATDGALVRRGRVALAPARHQMGIAQAGVFSLEKSDVFAGGGSSISRLFKTAAAAYGKRVIGVVLSGASHDETAALMLIEAAGGVCIVQDRAEAFDASTTSAIRSANAGYCIALERMAPLLIKLVSGGTFSEKFETARQR